MALSEELIINGINCKDDRYWNKVYNDFFPALCGYVKKLVKNDDAARDIVQNTFVAIWTKNIEFPDFKRLSIYLYRSAHNNALKYLKESNCHSSHLEFYQYESEEFTDEDFTLIIEQEIIRRLHAIICELPEQRRKILLMSLDGMKGQEIADQLQITIHTVKQQKYRAYKLIKEQLKHNLMLLLIIS